MRTRRRHRHRGYISEMTEQKPLELILARNLLASISTPAFLTGPAGRLLFFNDAAGAMVGRHFEETGTMEAEEWTAAFGPLGPDGEPMPFGEIPLRAALGEGRVLLFHHDPLHSDEYLDRFGSEACERWQSLGGDAQQIELARERTEIALEASEPAAAP